jgi:hypothetical protein
MKTAVPGAQINFGDLTPYLILTYLTEALLSCDLNRLGTWWIWTWSLEWAKHFEAGSIVYVVEPNNTKKFLVRGYMSADCKQLELIFLYTWIIL